MSDYSVVEVGTAGEGHVELAYSETGTGDDTVFLFHGVTANHRVWAPVQSALAERCRVIAVDQRGHGNSGKPDGGYTATEYSDDIRGLVERLGGHGRNVLVGHSLGSRNSIAAAARFPELVAGVVAIDFTPFIETEVFDTLETRVAGGDQRFASIAEIETYLHGRYPKMPGDAVARRAEYGYQLRGEEYFPLADPDAMRQTVAGLREDLAPSVRSLRTPTVMVRGAESVLVTGRAFERTRELRPDLGYEIVEGADHYVPEEQPGAIVSIVTGLIDRL